MTHLKAWWSLPILLILLFTPSLVRAQEFNFLGGLLQNSSDGNSYAWQLEYIEGLGENLAIGVTYLNEGHAPNHHRDGNALPLWAHTGLMFHRLSLAAGVGPYWGSMPIPSKSSIVGNIPTEVTKLSWKVHIMIVVAQAHQGTVQSPQTNPENLSACLCNGRF